MVKRPVLCVVTNPKIINTKLHIAIKFCFLCEKWCTVANARGVSVLKRHSLLHGFSIRSTLWFGFPPSVEIRVRIIYETDLALPLSHAFKTYMSCWVNLKTALRDVQK